MKKRLLLFLSAGILSGCSSVSVNHDFDDATNFSDLKTFAWQHAEQLQTGDHRVDNDLNDERIRNAVEAALSTKGFQPAGRTDADFLVAYFIDYQRKLSSSSVGIGMGRGSYRRYGGISYSTDISEYEQEVLTIDILDPTKEKTIWRGVGHRASYKGSNPEKTTKIVNDAVGRILKKFPPTKK